VEHPQELIDEIQYHRDPEMAFLPAASYALTAQVDGRGVYSFCMCPPRIYCVCFFLGGGLVVNGMTPSARHHPLPMRCGGEVRRGPHWLMPRIFRGWLSETV
jgi:uncharacterized FAD-dependent dehydrogenase